LYGLELEMLCLLTRVMITSAQYSPYVPRRLEV